MKLIVSVAILLAVQVFAKDCPLDDVDGHATFAKKPSFFDDGCKQPKSDVLTDQGECKPGYKNPQGTETHAKCCTKEGKWYYQVGYECKPIAPPTTTKRPNATTTTAPKPTTTTAPVPFKVDLVNKYEDGSTCLEMKFDALSVKMADGNKTVTYTVNSQSEAAAASGTCVAWAKCQAPHNTSYFCATAELKAMFSVPPPNNTDDNIDISITADFALDASFTAEDLHTIVDDGRSWRSSLSSLTVVANGVTADFDAHSVAHKGFSSKLNTSYHCDVTFSYKPNKVSNNETFVLDLDNVAVEAFMPKGSTKLGPEGPNYECPGSSPSSSSSSSSHVGVIVGAVIAGIAGLFIIAFVYKKCKGPSEKGYTQLEVN